MDNGLKIFIRYLIIVLIAIPNLFIFYFIFTPATIYPVFGLFKIFFKEVLLTDIVFQINNEFFIEIISACIAGSAYYLLFILNLSTPKIKIKKRIKMLLFSFAFLLILNILRIVILSLIFVYSSENLFDISHKLFWYFGTTFFVVLIWFIEVKTFKIKEIPIYSDIKFLYNKIRK
ncbi:MAG: pacearchaeosortase [Nanoarchaeota archaeon]|nr:pacearchaeosortase [Nanoarchaeota archaeon]